MLIREKIMARKKISISTVMEKMVSRKKTPCRSKYNNFILCILLLLLVYIFLVFVCMFLQFQGFQVIISAKKKEERKKKREKRKKKCRQKKEVIRCVCGS